MAMGQWEAEYQYWLQVQYRFQAFAREYKPGEPLPPFDSIVKPFQQSIPCAATGSVPDLGSAFMVRDAGSNRPKEITP